MRQSAPNPTPGWVSLGQIAAAVVVAAARRTKKRPTY